MWMMVDLVNFTDFLKYMLTLHLVELMHFFFLSCDRSNKKIEKMI